VRSKERGLGRAQSQAPELAGGGGILGAMRVLCWDGSDNVCMHICAYKSALSVQKPLCTVCGCVSASLRLRAGVTPVHSQERGVAWLEGLGGVLTRVRVCVHVGMRDGSSMGACAPLCVGETSVTDAVQPQLVARPCLFRTYTHAGAHTHGHAHTYAYTYRMHASTHAHAHTRTHLHTL